MGDSPIPIAICPKVSKRYVADSFYHRVLIFGPEGDAMNFNSRMIVYILTLSAVAFLALVQG
jgi:hypothetical protein